MAASWAEACPRSTHTCALVAARLNVPRLGDFVFTIAFGRVGEKLRPWAGDLIGFVCVGHKNDKPILRLLPIGDNKQS